jgi:hypothetical protein
MKYYYFLLALAFAACNLEKEIDLDLPVYTSKPVVECYLEEGKPYRLLLTNSLSYLEIPDSLPFYKGALVIIEHNGIKDTLQEGFFLDPFSQKLYNYGSSTVINSTFPSDFNLYIQTPSGDVITDTATFLPVIPIDSTSYTFVADTAAAFLMYFRDDQSRRNYYRQILSKGALVDKDVVRDITFTDDILSDSVIVGSGPFYKHGDTVTVSFYHMEREYYKFLESFQDAANANGNPFAQPTRILSTVKGNALGVFTTIAYDRKEVILP